MKYFEKLSAVQSEMIGTLLMPGNILGAVAGLIVGKKTKKDLKEQDKASWSNAIPGVGGYRLGRRIMSD